jgi:hypothetical protein
LPAGRHPAAEMVTRQKYRPVCGMPGMVRMSRRAK